MSYSTGRRSESVWLTWVLLAFTLPGILWAAACVYEWAVQGFPGWLK